ncbi:AGE family epimerase/isomerase [Pseudoxanthomonas dokdonensis]|uniref:N-acylglucosamine 2-epimerase n=1 Tax=Pseudoxanthomonas dokdonensis TaxID=344882 RepID=A0A0R0CVQ1_9GAMM|nr:AGE family epimerase/isomerase [Pseudoxanthomonas dokdonensis]KRG70578.1 N-acylglucosamine 2-epimerase [Pseudoxanthomonas dokdonensis]
MSHTVPPHAAFRSESFLRDHIRQTMAFYHPRCIDPQGGFFHYFKDDGRIYDTSHRHLVSSTRFVFNYATAALEFGDDDPALASAYIDAVQHGLKFLRDRHLDPVSGGYFWTLRDGEPEDTTQHCYGAAFVLLAYSIALKAGVESCRAWMDVHWNLLETRYWDPQYGLYRDEATRDWQFSDYRGQNANMHMCEAMLAAYEASGHTRYLERALLLANHMTRRQAGQTEGLIWEHYDAQWQVDTDYHRDDPRHLFRPWGFQPGHQTEWAKLLLILDRHLGDAGHDVAWLVPRARELFDRSVEASWDGECGGLVYGFAPESLRKDIAGPSLADGRHFICDDDKYFWVQAETMACAARLATVTGDDRYWQWYERLWEYAWTHMIDHDHGAWFRILDRHNRKYDDDKSPAGKTDYHTMGACHDVLSVFRAND